MPPRSQPETRPAVEPRFSDSAVGEARLVEEVRRGDQRAFEALVRRYERRLIRVIQRFVHDRQTAEDLAQETFLRAFQNLDRFDPSKRFGPWLFRIGVNLTLDYLRKRKRRGRWLLFGERKEQRPVEPRVRDPREALDLRQEIQAVLDQLPEKYRTVLVLRDLEGFSTSEIAAILNRKEATIRWRLAEARHRFQELWSKRLERVAPHRQSNRAHDDELLQEGTARHRTVDRK